MALNKNMQNIRYLNINTTNIRFEITLDISNCFPKKLNVYSIQYINDIFKKQKYSGAIQGT